MENVQLNNIDFFTIGFYFFSVLVVVLWYTRKKLHSQEDFFLGGRSSGWFVVGASLFAANISSEHLVGLSSLGAGSGMVGGLFEWVACLVLIALAWIFAPVYIKTKIFTLPEYLGNRYDVRSRWFLAIVSIAAYVLTKVSVILFAGSILLKSLLGWDFYTSAMLLAIVTGLYTVGGGLRSVMVSNTLQMIYIVVGASMLTFMSLDELGGIDALTAKVPDDFFQLFKPKDDPEYPWTGMIFGTMISGIWYWCTDQFMVQHLLSAKDKRAAQNGSLFAGFLKLLPVFIIIMPGLIAHALYPEMNGSEAYSVLVTDVLPPGFKGIVVAGLLAALMSSLASSFNATSTIFTLEIYKRKFPDAPEFRLVNVGRLATFVMVIISVVWVPIISNFSDEIFIYIQKIQKYIAPPIAVVFLLGIIWKRASANASFVVLMGGLLAGVFRLVIELVDRKAPFEQGWVRNFIDINFLHYSIFLFITGIVVMMLTSLMEQKSVKYAAAPYVFDKDLLKPFPKTVATLTFVLVGILTFLWVFFA